MAFKKFAHAIFPENYLSNCSMTQFNALIPAAESGSRMGNTLPKQYLQLNNHPMIYHAIKTLCSNQTLSKVFVVLSPVDHDWYN